MYKFFIGIDVSKPWIDVAYYSKGIAIYLGRFKNSVKGFAQLVQSLEKVTQVTKDQWFICFENTGTYSKQLFSWLYTNGVACIEENPLRIKRSLGLKRGKDDKTDAMAICMYIYTQRDQIKPGKPDSKPVINLKKLLSRRELLKKHKNALMVNLKEQGRQMDEETFKILKEQNEELIQVLKNQIKEIDKLMEEVIRRDPPMSKNYDLIRSVKGIGPVVAAILIAYTNNFKRFENARKFACYSGIAPFPNQSGISVRGKSRVSHMANKFIKAMLTMAANSAVMSDKELKIYYHRKMAEGKHYGTVLNAVKNKLVARVFAVVKRQSPFVPMMNYA